MPPPTDLSALEPLVEMLVETDEPTDRDRVLLDAPFFLGIAPAAALWRPAATKPGGPVDWHEIVARGPRETLPDKDLILAVVAGQLSGELPDGRRVLVAGSGRTHCVLALGGVLSSEESTDLIEALLVASAAIEEASSAPNSAHRLIDQVASPLPTSQTASGSTPEDYDQLCHDVRNHLASIRTTQELLSRYEDRLNEEERTHFRGVLEREVRRASGLLVQAVHPDTPDFRALRELLGCTRPAVVVSDVVAAERTASEQAGIALEFTTESDVDRLTSALDELSLARIVRNLLVNAREAFSTIDPAAAADPCVRVHVAHENKDTGVWMVITVVDNGPGIDASHLERIWEAGFTVGKSHGTGLGLNVVHELVTGAGGTVQARNLLPHGVRFELRLPPSGTADS
jgi:signal transduction histidine kinase